MTVNTSNVDNFTYLSLGLFLLGLSTIPSSTIHNLFLIFFLILFLSLSLLSFRATTIITIVFIPLAGLIKWSGSENMLTILFQTCIYLIALGATFIHVVVRGRFKIDSLPIFLFFPFIPFILIIFFHILITGFESPALGLALFRQYILSTLLFFVFFYALKKKAISVLEIISLIIVVTTLISIINIAYYFGWLESNYPRYIINPKFGLNIPQTRGIFGIEIPRSQHLLGLGSQGGGSVFYAIICSLSLLLMSMLKGKKKILAALASVILFIAGAKIFSGSFVMSLFFIGVFILIINYGLKSKILFFFKMLVLLMGIVYVLSVQNFSIGSQNQLFSYGKVFLVFGVELLSDAISGLNLLGKGMGYASNFDIDGAGYDVGFFDTWIFSVVPQIGLIGFLSMIASWTYWIILIIRRNRQNASNYFQSAIIGIILMGSFGYVHQAVFIDRLMVPLLMVALSILSFQTTLLKKSIRYRSDGENI